MTSSEDVGLLARAADAPLVFWWLGGHDPDSYFRALAAGRVDDEIPFNHSAQFAPVIEPTLTTGIQALVVAASEWLA